MTKHIVIVQENKHFNISWSALVLPEDTTLHLIAKPLVIEQMTDNKDLELFKTHRISESLCYKDILAFTKSVQAGLKEGDELIISTNEEFFLVPCANVREELRLHGDRSNDLVIFRDKTRMKEHLKKAPTADLLPAFIRFDEVAASKDPIAYAKSVTAQIPLPIFVKPVDAAGARRTAILNTESDLLNWIKSKKQAGEEYEFNELLTGDLYHIDSAVKDKQIIFRAVGRDSHPCHEFLDGKTNGTIHISRDSELFHRLTAVNEQIIKQYDNPPNGTYHLEVYYDAKKDSIRFVEITARPAGGFIPNMYRFIYGVDLLQLHYELQLNLPYKVSEDAGKRQYAWIAYPAVTGNITKEHELPQLTCQSNYQVLQPKDHDGNVSSIHVKSAQIAIWLDEGSPETIEADFATLDAFRPFSCKSEAAASAISLSEQVVKLYESHNIAYDVVTHDQAVSAADHSRARGTSPHSACKAMLLRLQITKSKKSYVLATLPGDMSIDLESLKTHYDCKRVSFASEDEVSSQLNCNPGEVAPFSFNKDIPMIIDPRLWDDNEMIYHGHGHLNQSIKVKSVDFKSLVGKLSNAMGLKFAKMAQPIAAAAVAAGVFVSDKKKLPTTELEAGLDQSRKP